MKTDETKKSVQSEEAEVCTEGLNGEERSAEMVRREFMKRFGSYTAGAALGLYILMSAKTSKAQGSGTGDDGAPI